MADLNQLISQALMNQAPATTNGLAQAIAQSGKSDAWNAMQIRDAQLAAQAGLPFIQGTPDEAPGRLRLIDAINRLQSTGIKFPYFIGKPNEPLGDRGVTMDTENLVKGLKTLESQAKNAGDLQALKNISAERAYWENDLSEGMSAEDWKRQTGESDPVYPAQ